MVVGQVCVWSCYLLRSCCHFKDEVVWVKLQAAVSFPHIKLPNRRAFADGESIRASCWMFDC